MKKSLSIIGVGAFGGFMVPHLAPHFNLRLHDSSRDLTDLAQKYNADIVSLKDAAQSDFIVLAVPVLAMAEVAKTMAPLLQKGQLLMDVGSVKMLTRDILHKEIPEHIDLVGLHPMFGPQSAAKGIKGHNVAVVPFRGTRHTEIEAFLKHDLELNVIPCSAEEHDQQMAYVQGLTHMIGKVFTIMDLPPIIQKTRTFELLEEMVNMIKNDSDALFKTIQSQNPYAESTKAKFFNAVKTLENNLRETD